MGEWRRVALLGLMLCLLPQCAGAPPRAKAPVAQRQLGQHVQVAGLLPAHALGFVALRQPFALLERLGKKHLIAAERERYERMLYDLGRELGHDLSRPRSWRRLGIDPDGEVVFAFVSSRPRKATLVVALPLIDEAALRAGLYRAARKGRRHRPRVHGTRTYLRVGRLGFVIDDSQLLAVAGRDRRETTRQLAMLAPSESLAREPRYAAAMQSLDAGGDATLYLDTARLALWRRRSDPRWLGANGQEALLALESKRAAALAAMRRDPKATPARLATVDARFEEAREALVDALADESEHSQLRKWLAGVGAAGGRLSLSAQGLDVQLIQRLESSSPWHGLLRNQRGVPTLVRSARRAPAASLQLNLDLKVLLERVRDAAGDELPQLGAATPEQWVETFTGELALGAWLKPSADRWVDGIERDSIELGALLGLRDAAKAETLLSAMSESDDLGWLLKKSESGYQLGVPGLPAMSLAVDARQGYLMLRSHPRLFDGLAATKRRGHWGQSGPFRLVRQSGNAMHMGVDLGVATFVGASEATRRLAPRRVEDPAEAPKKERVMLDQLHELEAEIAGRRRARTLEARHQLALVARRLGRVALRVRHTSEGLELRGEHRLARGGYAGLLRAALQQIERKSRDGDAELAALESKRLELELDLEDLRRQRQRETTDADRPAPAK
jgi:hypothetical protein